MTQNSTTTRNLWLVTAQVLLLAVLYFTAGQVSFSLSVSHNIVTLVIFAAEGFSLAAVILFGTRLWLGVFLGQLALALYNGLSWYSALGVSSVNSVEAVIGAVLFHRLALQPSFEKVRDVSGLWLLVFLVLQPFSATLGNLVLWLDGVILTPHLAISWFSWWFGNSLGQVLIAPLLLSFFTHKKLIQQNLHGILWLVLLIIPVSILKLLPISFSIITIAFTLAIPLLILIAVKNGMAMVNLATVIFTAIILFITKQQLIEVLDEGDIVLLVDLNVHLLAILLIGQFIAALLSEYKQLRLTQEKTVEQLQKITDHVPGIIYQFRLNPDGSYCFPYANLGLQTIYGISPEEAMENADNVFTMIHPDDYDQFSASIADSAQHLIPRKNIYRIYAKDGTLHWLSGHSIPQREENGATLWYGFVKDITEFKRKEIEYQTVIETSFSGFWCNDFSGRFLDVNSALSGILGYTRQELLNMTIMDIEAVENPADTAARIQTIIQTGHDSFESQHRRKDGRIIDVEINVLYIKDLSQRFFVFINDITERKQAQNALMASEEKYRTLFNSIQDGIVFVDMQGTILECNQCYAAMLGYSKEELRKKITFHQVTPEKWYSLEAEMIEKEVMNRGHCELFEKEYIRKDGTVFPIELRAWLAKDKQDNNQGMWAIIRDISKRKHMEEELRKSHNELLHYFNQHFIGMLTATHDKKTIHANQHFCDIVGYSQAEMETIDWGKLIHPDDLALNQAYLSQAIRGEIDAYQMEKRYIHKDGHIVYVDLAVKCVRDAEGNPDYFIGMMLDITERKLIEQYLQKNQALLQTAQRAARLGHYVTDIKTGTWTNDILFDEIFGIDSYFKRDFAHWQQLIFPEDTERAINYFEQTINDHEFSPFIEYRIIRPCDGRVYWVAAWVHNFYDENNVPIQQVGMVQDVTERKLAEQQIQESEERLNLSQEYGGIGSWEADLVNNRQIWSRTVHQLLGFPALSNPTWEDFLSVIHPDDRQTVIDANNAHLNHKGKYDVEYRAILTDGQIHWMRSAGQAQFADDGTAIKFIGIVQDITERKQAEIKLRIAATVFESQEGMLITDANCVILKVNHAFTRITGYSATEAIGQTPSFLQSGRHDKVFYLALWQSINDTGAWQGEIWDKRKNGEIYPQWLTITAVKDKDNNVVTHYVSTLTDITERKATEETINHLAFYDPLTQLPNRRLLQERLKHGIEINHRTGSLMAVMMMDLDKFKAVNDNLGHAAGDVLLQQVAERIKNRLREMDMVARLGGDEFVIVIEGVSHYEDVAHIAEAIIQTLSEPFTLYDTHTVFIGASIGIAFHPQHGDSAEILTDNADTALYHAKNQGRGCFAYYSDVLKQKKTVPNNHEI